MQTRTKIVFLAIDAGDQALIQDWVEDGTLPNVRSLMERGLAGETQTVPGVYEGATWPSFYTGVNPGRHGFHRLDQMRPGSYGLYQRRPDRFIEQDPFWVTLSRQGRKVAVLDVPLAGLASGLNGIQTVEWGSHDGVYGFQTWPRELKADILRRFGPHPVPSPCDGCGRTVQDFLAFKSALLAGVARKCALTLHFLRQGGWDFFAQVFTEAHCAGHQCWHLHDPAHPNHDPRVVSQTGDVMKEVYRAIDAAVGEILREVDDDTTVFLLATHGMAHNVGAQFMLERILEELNYLKWRSAPHPRGEGRETLAELFLMSSRIDMARTQCFPHANGNLVGGIRINKDGREPGGIVKAGAEWDDLCERLRADLLDIRESPGGRPVIREMHRSADLFAGERCDHLPDLLIEWNDDIVIGTRALRADESCRLRLTSGKIGVLEGEYTYCRTGDHRREGLFVTAGPGITPGRMGRAVSIMDFAPTFLKLLGLEPAGFDGRPIMRG